MSDVVTSFANVPRALPRLYVRLIIQLAILCTDRLVGPLTGEHPLSYLLGVENVPDDLQRLMSLMRELDAKTQGNQPQRRVKESLPKLFHCQSTFLALMRRLKPNYKAYIESFDSEDIAKRRQLHQEVLRGVLLCREFGDEKLQLASQMQELVSENELS